MVSRSPDNPEFSSNHLPKTTVPPVPLPEVATRLITVTVPVFLTITVPADDREQAEYLAVEVVRALPETIHGGATVRFASVLGPMAQD